MPTFNRDALRKGAAAIDAALEARKKGGERRSFLPNFYWKNDKDYRYLMFLNPLDEIGQVDFHPYIDCDDGVPHMAIARTDATVGGAAADPIQERWGYKPRLMNLAIAVELEPVIEMVGKYAKPVGFEVKTNEFERSVRDDEGNTTDEKERVEAPVVGLVVGSPYTLFAQLRSFDATEAQIHTTPVKITRLGKDSVTYSITGYDSLPPEALDLSGLFDNIENLSYITEPDALISAIEAADDQETATVAVGDYLLYKRLEELADEDNYNAILNKITKPAKFQEQKAEEKPKKPSQRRSAEEAPAARVREPEAKVTKESPATARLDKLRKQHRAKAESE